MGSAFGATDILGVALVAVGEAAAFPAMLAVGEDLDSGRSSGDPPAFETSAADACRAASKTRATIAKAKRVLFIMV